MLGIMRTAFVGLLVLASFAANAADGIQINQVARPTCWCSRCRQSRPAITS